MRVVVFLLWFGATDYADYVVSCDISACVSAATRRKTSDQISCVRYHLLKQHLLDRTVLLR